MGLLGGLIFIFEFAGLDIFRPVLAADLVLDGIDSQFAEAEAVGTHIGDLTALVQLLGQQHGAADGIAQFAAGFLLQSGGGKGGRRRLFGRFDLDVGDRIIGAYAALQEFFSVFGGSLLFSLGGERHGFARYVIGGE